MTTTKSTNRDGFRMVVQVVFFVDFIAVYHNFRPRYIIAFVSWSIFSNSVFAASFYGGSYILIPFKEARSSTDIHFKLKTHLPNALILLAVGATDYCIVRLENGRLKVNINLGAGESELLTAKDVKLNDFKWHDVFVIRKEANLSILVDSVHRVE